MTQKEFYKQIEECETAGEAMKLAFKRDLTITLLLIPIWLVAGIVTISFVAAIKEIKEHDKNKEEEVEF